MATRQVEAGTVAVTMTIVCLSRTRRSRPSGASARDSDHEPSRTVTRMPVRRPDLQGCLVGSLRLEAAPALAAEEQ